MIKNWAKKKIIQVVLELYDEFVADAKIELTIESAPDGYGDKPNLRIKYTKPLGRKDYGEKKV